MTVAHCYVDNTYMNSRNDLCHDDSTINIVVVIIIIIIIIIITYKLPHRTAQQIPARRPGITAGFSTGKKLPHAVLSGWKQLHQAYNPVGIHQMAPLNTHPINRPTTHLSTLEG